MRSVLLLLLVVLLLPTQAPYAAASSWEEDGWLKTVLADERLEAGDEFGCSGMPGLSWASDPGAVATACRSYLLERTPASKWGEGPVSLGTPRGLTAADHTTLARIGFTVHGDELGLTSTAWHAADDVPVFEEDWFDLGRRGGSLELGVADPVAVEQALDEGGLVNFYWVGRVGEITIRHDGDVVDLLLARDDVWFTTWGEAWSTWAIGRCHEALLETVDNGQTVRFTLLDTEACKAANPEAWSVPTTWRLSFPTNRSVLMATIDGAEVEDLTGVRNTAVGWRTADGEVLASLRVGQSIEFKMDAPVNRSDLDVLGMSPRWNGYDVAVTVAGHDTTDLHRWSRRFVDADDLRFTWLISPRDGDPELPWLPWLGVLTAAATVVAMRHFIRSDDGSSALAPMGKDWSKGEEE